MKQFIKSTELQLINGGYLTTKSEVPVTNEAFITAQKQAEYIVTFAEMAEGKNFTGTKADSLEALKLEVHNRLNGTQSVEYVAKLAPVATPTQTKLANEALAFLENHEANQKIDKVNTFLQQFNILKEFEDFGLFFDQGIVKLNRIYTVAEITGAVNKVIDLLK